MRPDPDSVFSRPGRSHNAILSACSLASPATSQAVKAIETAMRFPRIG
jgi:hypothetical protein